jgi:hypothetical protein
MGNVLTMLSGHPDEASLVGEILIAYGELENSLIDLLDAVLDEDQDTALRTLFRLRSEGQRLDVADAVARKWMTQQNLEGVYSRALGAIKRCKTIRNQYAHCTWFPRDGRLFFIDLEATAKTAEGPCMLRPRRIDLPLLQKQREFFDYTEDLLVFVAESYRRSLGRGKRGRGEEAPKQLPHPDLYLS